MARNPHRPEWPTPEEKLVEATRRYGIGIEGRSTNEVRKAVEEAWLLENGEALKAWNAWVRKNGLSLARYRAF